MNKAPIPSKRDQKLAAKLKENLRRRKAQARARAASGEGARAAKGVHDKEPGSGSDEK